MGNDHKTITTKITEIFTKFILNDVITCRFFLIMEFLSADCIKYVYM